MLLAAGKGTRLLPLTESISKCMVLIQGKPILQHNLEHLRRYGVTEIVINLHHQPDTIIQHFQDGSALGVHITYSLEPQILGTAGGLKRVAEYFDEPFFVWYGDNFSTCQLDRLWEMHSSKNGLVTMSLYYRPDPTQSGIVELDRTGRILRFIEKPQPQQVFSHWVNAGILVMEPQVLHSIPAGVSDFGRDIFPKLLDRGEAMYGYRMSADERLWWIDTWEDYKRIQAMIPATDSISDNKQ